MKKFINITSLLTALTIFALDASVMFFTVFSVKKLSELRSAPSVVFLVLMIVGVIIAICITVNQCRSGVRFFDENCVFNSLDSDNEFRYDEIKSVRIEKDDKISFTKNFTDRYGYISIATNDGKLHTFTLGLVSGRKLKKIKNQIEMRM